MAQLFGTTLQAQAFVVAFRLPNVLRDLVAEGAVTSAFVPVLSWYRAKRPPEEFWRLTQALGVRLVVLLCLIGAAGSLAAPAIVRLVAPGFAADPDKFRLTVTLTRVLFPFITLVGLWAYFMGVLNSLRHFIAPALGPAILNVAMIAACLWSARRGVEHGALALAVAVIIGGVVQLLVQIPVAVRRGYRWGWRWHHPGSAEILRLLGPRMVGSAVYQASVLVDTALASLSFVVGEGAVAALYYANRLVQLPLALFGTASSQASLPALAEQAAHQDWAAFQSTVVSVMRAVSFVLVPSAVGLMVLAFPIVRGLFGRGAFDERSVTMTAQALLCYAVGLLAYAMSKVLTGAFYALQETKAPVRLAVEAMGVNLVLSLVLMWPLRLSGLALAAAVSNSVNAYRLTTRLERRLGRPLMRPAARALPKLCAASGVMGVVCAALWHGGLRALPVWAGLPLVLLAGLASYAAACAALRVEEWHRVLQWITPPAWRRRSASA